ncbi:MULTISPECIES: hypothetical protein [Mycobacterium]|uniref:hypothetical protein n=1 Tax=Mycobacterium TaxID=1763 RepID=UPI001356681C|nr:MULTISPECIES: hypothetical protein [Mycobacterium]MBI2702092.1 hypothetical protein [Mycobacterium sp.]MCV7009371.1 hypothetical protein [Mycobacterium gordonae]MDP7729483.1 hypothetical protein [Mycobacterium sp. TY813]
MIGPVFVPGGGPVWLKVSSVTKGVDSAGKPVLYVHIAPDFGGGPGGGEPLPLADAA